MKRLAKFKTNGVTRFENQRLDTAMSAISQDSQKTNRTPTMQATPKKTPSQLMTGWRFYDNPLASTNGSIIAKTPGHLRIPRNKILMAVTPNVPMFRAKTSMRMRRRPILR